eukprot:TRINITY_DN12314_c0_g1_i1.p1 TRINITY_DN12314_c0_g1~~TRINITY_DN12314_c0_g1_i1.p1  ORF type:complete len:221 (+),score=36.00 TRINITY_DN12314_c0_g1_i1:56-718(+)
MRTPLCLLTLLVFFVDAVDIDCSRIEGKDGKYFDLSSVIGQELAVQDGFSTFKATICQNPYQCGDCGPTSGYCETSQWWEDCIGIFTSAAAIADMTGVELMYDNGDWGSFGRVKILCNPDADTLMNIRGESFNKVIVAEGKQGCALVGGGGLSGGSVILILLFVFAVVYLVAGVLYNKFRLNKDGIELIPNLDFWKDFPSLVKDGFFFTVSKFKALAGME